MHDSLAPFVRQSRTRPLIVKVHGDARLAPRNTVDETAELSAGMTSALATVLNDRALVFAGYGGNDQSIAGLIRALPRTTFQWGIYWVGESFPTGPVGEALRGHQDLWWVPHLDFDALMLLIAEEFQLGAPSFDRWMKLRDAYERTLDRRGTEAATPADHPESEVSRARAGATADRMSARIRAHSLLSQAQAMVDDPGKADDLFRQAEALAPDDPLVLASYAVFLRSVLHDYDRAEEHFCGALALDPTRASALGNYAVFLEIVRHDNDGAEDHHRRAVAAPHPRHHLGNYA